MGELGERRAGLVQTTESLVAGDTDTGCGPLLNEAARRLRALGRHDHAGLDAAGGNGAFDAVFDGTSGDGSHVFFHTAEPLAGDTDTKRDIYEHSGGTTTRVSTGPTGGNGAIDAFFAGNSRDGTRVFFETAEALASDTRHA